MRLYCPPVIRSGCGLWVVLVLILDSSVARAIPLNLFGYQLGTQTSSAASPYAIDIEGALFARARHRRVPGQDPDNSFSLTRARIGLTLRYKKLVRITIEPDFAGGDADPADVFLQLRPVSYLDLRIGQHKSPYGLMELESRWRLPAQRRGLVSSVVRSRLGIGGRRLGLKARVRLKKLRLKPRFEMGAYRDTADDRGTDGALFMSIRPFLKGAKLALAGYAKAEATSDQKYGYAGAISFLYNRKAWYVGAEFMIVRARLLSLDGTGANQDATLYAARALLAYKIKLSDFRLQPFVGFDGIDPNGRTRSDLGFSARGGLNLKFKKIIRTSAEVEYQKGQLAFIEPERLTFTLFVGALLE